LGGAVAVGDSDAIGFHLSGIANHHSISISGHQNKAEFITYPKDETVPLKP